jgi:hypothetical protein
MPLGKRVMIITVSGPRSFSKWLELGGSTRRYFGLDLACCDCGLFHRHEYKLSQHRKSGHLKIEFRTRRLIGKTKAYRKRRKFKCR